MKTFRLRTMIPLCAALAFAPVAIAEDAPLSYKAAPDVYKLLAENDQFRVVLQSIKPGQRDAWHSHSALVSYRLTDCTSRLHYPDGKVTEATPRKAGEVNFLPAQPKHSLENMGKTVCQGLIVERK
jgi:quercetin dioxygenase-like cupin family protein